MTKVLFVLLFLLFPLGQLVKIPLWGKVSVLPQEIVLFVLLARFMVLGEWRKISQITLVKEVAIFSIVALLSLLLSPLRLNITDLAESASYLARFLLYFGVYVVSVYELQKKSLTKEFLSKGLLFSALFFAILGLGQYFLYPVIGNLSYLGWDVHQGRLVSTFLDPGFTGLIFVLGFLLMLGYPDVSSGKTIKCIGLVFLAICLLLTYSRSSWLAFEAGLVIYCLIKKDFKLPVVMTILFLLGILLVPKPSGEGGNLGRTVSSLARVGDWQISTSIWQHSPLWGMGFNAYRFARAQYGFIPPNRPEVQDDLVNHSLSGADNSFLLLLATTGILGLLAFLNLGRKLVSLLLFKPLGYSRDKLREKSVNSSRSMISNNKVVALASLGAIIVHTFFQNSLFYPFVMEWMWIMVAMTNYTSRDV